MDKGAIVRVAAEILETETGASAANHDGVIVQCGAGGCFRAWYNWALDVSKCGEYAGGWSLIRDLYCRAEDKRFSPREKGKVVRFWWAMRTRKLLGNGYMIAERMEAD